MAACGDPPVLSGRPRFFRDIRPLIAGISAPAPLRLPSAQGARQRCRQPGGASGTPLIQHIVTEFTRFCQLVGFPQFRRVPQHFLVFISRPLRQSERPARYGGSIRFSAFQLKFAASPGKLPLPRRRLPGRFPRTRGGRAVKKHGCSRIAPQLSDGRLSMHRPVPLVAARGQVGRAPVRLIHPARFQRPAGSQNGTKAKKSATALTNRFLLSYTNGQAAGSLQV